MDGKAILKYLEEHPSVYTLLKMVLFSINKNEKYKIIGIVREPLLHTTGKNGFDFHHGYYFIDENNHGYTLAKKESILLAGLGMVSNADANSNKDGLREKDCDLRKLKSVIPSNTQDYLSENEQKMVISELDKIKTLLILGGYNV